MNHFPDAADPQCTCGFEQLVTPHLPNMLRTARRVLKSDDLAWDAVQECLVHVWNNRRLGPDPALALGHVTNLKSLAIHRAELRRIRREDAAARRADADADPATDHPEAVCQRLERRAVVRRAIASLPADCAAAVELCELQGVDQQRAALRLAIPAGTLRSRLHRARRLLRSRLSEFDEADAGIVGSAS